MSTEAKSEIPTQQQRYVLVSYPKGQSSVFHGSSWFTDCPLSQVCRSQAMCGSRFGFCVFPVDQLVGHSSDLLTCADGAVRQQRAQGRRGRRQSALSIGKQRVLNYIILLFSHGFCVSSRFYVSLRVSLHSGRPVHARNDGALCMLRCCVLIVVLSLLLFVLCPVLCLLFVCPAAVQR